MTERRRYVLTIGSLALGVGIAGCAGDQDDDVDEESPTATATATASPTPTPTSTSTSAATTESGVVEVAVGPERRLRFVPEDVEISVGDTVRWVAESSGHNVSSKPGADPKCENPEGAEPFASYEGDQHYAIMEVDAVYEHQFTVPGEYVYVCVPHAGQGMVGTVTVSE